jgi:cell division protein FtsZ
MALEIDMMESISTGATLRVIGVGGGGNNALNNMIDANLKGVEFIAANTDIQDLEHSKARVQLQLGRNLTRGLGAGADPLKGRDAALEDKDKIKELLTGSDMVFITAGLGGGTGTGGAPVIAEVAKDLGALTVAVVTKPFEFEGKKRMQAADDGVEELKKAVDTLIVIPNTRLRSLAPKNAKFTDMLKKADEVLLFAVKGISDLIVSPGLFNLDFADVRTIMSEMGVALMGTGQCSGEDRAMLAAQAAVSNPLLEDVSIDGARGVLVNITASSEMSIDEVSEASHYIQEAADDEANIIWGAIIDDNMGDDMRVTVIATGIGDAPSAIEPEIIKPIQHLDPTTIDHMDLPQYHRKVANAGMAAVGGGGGQDLGILPTNTDDLDLPTFMRRDRN